MANLLSRLYNFVTDKTNQVKITASRVDGELDQLVAACNRKVLCSASAPGSPIAGQTWVDTTNKLLKVYRSNEWVTIGVVHIAASVMASPQEGDLWYDTANNLLKTYNGATWDTVGNMIYPSSTAKGDLLYLSAASTLARLPATDNAAALIFDLAATAPAWGLITTVHLKTTTGEISTAANTPANLTLPGGEYGFYPQIKAATAGADAIYTIYRDGIGTEGASYVTNIGFYNATYVSYAQQRYVTASGEDMWIFLLIDKITKEIIGAYQAPDAPHYGNSGDYNKVPHPFGNYNPDTQEIILLDKGTANLIKSQATEDRSILTIINEDMRVDYAKEKVYEPLHSGKFLTKDGKYVKEMVTEIAPYIKVKPLIKLTQAEKDAKEVIRQQKTQEAQEKKAEEDLIEAKIEEIAITELRKEGKIK